MGASLSITNKKAQILTKQTIQNPIFLSSCISSRYLGYSDVRCRYLARDPHSHVLYISGDGETTMLSRDGRISRIKHRKTSSHYPFTFGPSFTVCPLSCSPLMLIAYQKDVAVCTMDGQLVTMVGCIFLRFEEKLITMCADSTSVFYTLSQVIRHGAVRGEITEISCQLTRAETFHFGANHIKVARDMCKVRNKLFVLHESEKCVLVFSTDGTFLSALVSTRPCDFPNAIFNPMQMTVDSKQNLVISSWGEDTISLINSEGNVVSKISSTSEVPFSKPSGLCLDESDRTLYCLTKGEQPQLFSFTLPSELKMF